MPRSNAKAQSTLIKALEANGGRLGNLNARRILSQELSKEVSPEDYEQLKEQLLSEGRIKRAMGRGGAIELLPAEPEPEQADNKPKTNSKETPQQRLDVLFEALTCLPGMRAKMNKTTITMLCGEDNDKLYSGWDESKSAYFIQYRVESGRDDHSSLVEGLFHKASSGIPYASTQRNAYATVLQLSDNVAQVNRVVRRLVSLLEDVTLGNAPQLAEAPKKPRTDSYFLEIATLIKLCVDNDLRWPLKNWRKSLGFDDVDDLIVIGASPMGRVERYREHVVPVSLIKEEAIKLAEKGASEKVIADFIQHHLYVVLISKSEASILNSTIDEGGLSLKTSMPEGWVVGCDPLERLKEAGIQISYDQPIPLPEWKPWRKPGLRDKMRKILNTPVIRV